MSASDADLLALMRTDSEVRKRRRVEQAPVDLETTGSRPRRRGPDPTDDRINEAFKQATSV
jgi:hypothetical protein